MANGVGVYSGRVAWTENPENRIIIEWGSLGVNEPDTKERTSTRCSLAVVSTQLNTGIEIAETS